MEVLPAVTVVKLWTVSRVVTVETAGTEVEVVEIVTIVPYVTVVRVVVVVTVRQKSHFCYTNANHSDSADSLQCQSSGKQVG